MRERAEGREGREIRVWVEGDRKGEKTGGRGALLMRNSSLFRSTAGKFPRGTDNIECWNPVPTHPDDLNALFLMSTLRLASGSSSFTPKAVLFLLTRKTWSFPELGCSLSSPPALFSVGFLLPFLTQLWMKSHAFHFEWEFFPVILKPFLSGEAERGESKICLLWVKQLLEKGRSHMLQSVAFHHFQTNLSWQELSIGWQEI